MKQSSNKVQMNLLLLYLSLNEVYKYITHNATMLLIMVRKKSSGYFVTIVMSIASLTFPLGYILDPSSHLGLFFLTGV